MEGMASGPSQTAFASVKSGAQKFFLLYVTKVIDLYNR
jgi:hypothetical protein